MIYQKILRFVGGTGGDVLIKSILLSYPEFTCNYNYYDIKETTGAQDLQPSENFNILFPNLKNLHLERHFNFKLVDEEVNKLILLKKNFILRAHYIDITSNIVINLIPTEKTKDFIVAAYLKKRGYKYTLWDKTDFLKLKKLKKEKYIKNIADSMYFELDNIILNHQNDEKIITTENLLLCNFHQIEEKINLKLNQNSKNYLEKWSNLQFKIYGDLIKL